LGDGNDYCEAPGTADPLSALNLAGHRPADGRADSRSDGPRAACVLCGEPGEYPAETEGSPLCPRCAWQQAQRGACSG
jgi:hypothetical protein